MFDFAWTEIALIGIVALIAIGPKDMPVAIRAVSGAIKKARRMAGEFQTHVDEMVREANLDEVRSSFSELRSFNVRGQLQKHVDPKGELRSAFSMPASVMTAKPPASTGPLPDQVGAIEVADRPKFEPPALARPAAAAQAAPREAAPAFIPPAIGAPPPRPAFIPPGAPAPGA